MAKLLVLLLGVLLAINVSAGETVQNSLEDLYELSNYLGFEDTESTDTDSLMNLEDSEEEDDEELEELFAEELEGAEEELEAEESEWHVRPRGGGKRRGKGRRRPHGAWKKHKGGRRPGSEWRKDRKQQGRNGGSSTSDSAADNLLGKKITQTIHKHKKMSHKIFKQANKLSLLCSLADNLLEVSSQEVSELPEPHKHWLEQWKTWREDINDCCQTTGTVDEECMMSVGHLSLSRPVLEEEEDKTDKICKRLTETKGVANVNKLERVSKRQEKKGLTLSEEDWMDRREAMAECCELINDTSRIECLDDIKANKMDDMCANAEQPGQQLRGRAYHLTKKCCGYEDEERYQCFEDAMKWKKHHRGGKRKGGHDRQDNMWKRRCCQQGKRDGEGVQQDRWQTCQDAAESFVEEQTGLTPKSANFCQRKLRRCCMRESKTQTTQTI